LHEAILLRREDVKGTTPPIAVTQPLRGEIDELLWNIRTVIQKTSLSVRACPIGLSRAPVQRKALDFVVSPVGIEPTTY
jgi:hypothetical protein